MIDESRNNIKVGDLISWCGEYYHVENDESDNPRYTHEMNVIWRKGIVIDIDGKSITVVGDGGEIYEIGKSILDGETLQSVVRVESRST